MYVRTTAVDPWYYLSLGLDYVRTCAEQYMCKKTAAAILL